MARSPQSSRRSTRFRATSLRALTPPPQPPSPETRILTDPAALNAITVKQLRMLCVRWGLPTIGKKQDLIDRLFERGQQREREAPDPAPDSDWSLVDTSAIKEQGADFEMEDEVEAPVLEVGEQTVDMEVNMDDEHVEASTTSDNIGLEFAVAPSRSTKSLASTIASTIHAISTVTSLSSRATFNVNSRQEEADYCTVNPFSHQEPVPLPSGLSAPISSSPDSSLRAGGGIRLVNDDDEGDRPTGSPSPPRPIAPVPSTRQSPSLPFVFGSTHNQSHAFTFAEPSGRPEYRTAAQQVMDELNARTKSSRPIGESITSWSHVPSGLGTSSNGPPSTFDKAHKRTFAKMDSIENHYAAKRPAPSTTLGASTSSRSLKRAKIALSPEKNLVAGLADSGYIKTSTKPGSESHQTVAAQTKPRAVLFASGNSESKGKEKEKPSREEVKRRLQLSQSRRRSSVVPPSRRRSTVVGRQPKATAANRLMTTFQRWAGGSKSATKPRTKPPVPPRPVPTASIGSVCPVFDLEARLARPTLSHKETRAPSSLSRIPASRSRPDLAGRGPLSTFSSSSSLARTPSFSVMSKRNLLATSASPNARPGVLQRQPSSRVANNELLAPVGNRRPHSAPDEATDEATESALIAPAESLSRAPIFAEVPSPMIFGMDPSSPPRSATIAPVPAAMSVFERLSRPTAAPFRPSPPKVAGRPVPPTPLAPRGSVQGRLTTAAAAKSPTGHSPHRKTVSSATKASRASPYKATGLDLQSKARNVVPLRR